MNPNRLFVIVEKFRKAIERNLPKFQLTSFSYFPHGSCDDASDLLGYFLNHQYKQRFQCVSGLNKSRQSHTWLQQKGLIIDITADQFPSRDPVIVTLDHEFHNQFYEDGRCRLPSLNGSV